MRELLARYLRTQFSPTDQVVPEARFDPKKNEFFLNSEAGLIIFRARTVISLTQFRNKYINRFQSLREAYLRGEKVASQLHSLYAEIRGTESVKYRATLRVRMKAGLCKLIP